MNKTIRKEDLEEARALLEGKVIKQEEKDGGCWLWKVLPSRGYPSIRFKGVCYRANRFAYMVYVSEGDPIPDGLCACHTCDVRSCVNFAHIFISDQNGNVQDMIRKGRKKKRTNVIFSSDHRKKIGEANKKRIYKKGYKHTPEQLEKMSIRGKNFWKNATPEYKENIRKMKKDFKHSEETKKKWSMLRKGTLPVAALKKIAENRKKVGYVSPNTGRYLTNDVREKVSKGLVEYYKKNRNIEKICKHCNKSFLGLQNQKFCCKSCEKKSNKERNQPIVEKKLKVCMNCKKEFIGHSIKSYCSEKCRKMQKAIRKKEVIKNSSI